MYRSGPGSDHSQHDGPQTGPSPAGRARRSLCLHRQFDQWLIAVRIVGSLSDNMSALDLQAATGLLAVLVLLVIMNWFFHKIYWGGWIRAHNRRRRALLENARTAEISQRRLWFGIAILLGLTVPVSRRI